MSEEGRRTIHYTELPPAQPGEPLAAEWNTYLREAPRLLAEGLEGKFVLIKGQEVIGTYDTLDAAHVAGLRQYLGQPFMVRRILARDPVVRIRGCYLAWPI
jgi:hypothetical protein